MNLETKYLNLTLRSPLVVSACPLSKSLDNIKRMEEVGASAVVLYSLFEEQIRLEQQMVRYFQQHPKATSEDAHALFPAQEMFPIRLDEYLEHLTSAKRAVSIPIIASINCRGLGSWTDVVKSIQDAGADALEINVYPIPTSMEQTAAQVESMYLYIVKVLKETVRLPLAIKLAPFFTNLPNMVRLLDEAGVNAFVLFNRFYLPDLDPITMQLKSDIPLGSPVDSRLPLHWIALLYGRVKADFAATGGIYTAEDVVKMMMVGAKVTMLASALLKEGIDHLAAIESDLRAWLDQNDYTSVASLQGSLRQFHSRDTGVFERTHYIQAITAQDGEDR